MVQLKSGYGFITPDKGDHDFFFLWEDLENCEFDELSIGAPTTACEVRDGTCTPLVVTPELVGLPRGAKSDLAGGDPAENAAILRAVLGGEPSPRRNAVLLNAGAGLYVAGKAPDLAAAVRLAADQIDTGAALRTLEAAVRLSNQ